MIMHFHVLPYIIVYYRLLSSIIMQFWLNSKYGPSDDNESHN